MARKRDTFSGMSKQADEVKSWRLSDAYAVPGFRVLQRVDSHEFDRRIWKRTDRFYGKRWRRVRDLGCGDREVYLDIEMRRVNCKTCGVKNERLAFLSDNTKYTLRFAMQIGGLCRAMTIKDVSRHMRLDWHTVKELEKIYMREQLRLAGPDGYLVHADDLRLRRSGRCVPCGWPSLTSIWRRSPAVRCCSQASPSALATAAKPRSVSLRRMAGRDGPSTCSPASHAFCAGWPRLRSS